MKVIMYCKVLLFVLFVSLTSCDKDNENTNEKGENGNGVELGESGKKWNRADQANEVVNGINLILSYDSATESFKGTLHNLNTKIAPQVRVEVHVYDSNGNSKEYGPTTPADMQPNEKRSVVLKTTGAGNFVTFAMHPEVGGSSSENQETGNEGNHNENGSN